MALFRRGRIYWYDFRFGGKRYQASTRSRNKRAAESIAAKARADLALGLHGLSAPKIAPVLSDYAKTFTSFVELRNVDHPQTVEFYKEKLARLLEFPPLARQRLDAIDETLIEEYSRRRCRDVSIASVNRELATLRRLLRVAWKTHKLIRGVPNISLLPGEIGRDFILTYEQEAAYLAVAPPTVRDFAILSLDTGVRAGEALALEWADVHFDAANNAKMGYVQIRKGKSLNARRVLSMTPRVNAALKARREFWPDNRLVFQSQRKKDSPILVSSLDHMHWPARAAARYGDGQALPDVFVLHSLRHTFGTRLGESGADAFTIMRIMGHSSVTVSQKYVHPTPESMERAFERLNSMNALMRGEGAAAESLGLPAKITTPRR